MQAIFSQIENLTTGKPTNSGSLFLAATVILVYAIIGFALASTRDKRQLLSSTLKLPFLPLLTTAICLPGLLMMSAVMGLQLSAGVVLGAILEIQSFQGLFIAAFLPVIVFFRLGSGYDFVKLLYVTVFFIGGSISLRRLLQFLQLQTGGDGIFLFICWGILYGFVGCQMAWFLRPIIGSPSEPFAWLRRSGELNFYTALYISLKHCLELEEEPRTSETLQPHADSRN